MARALCPWCGSIHAGDCTDDVPTEPRSLAHASRVDRADRLRRGRRLARNLTRNVVKTRPSSSGPEVA